MVRAQILAVVLLLLSVSFPKAQQIPPFIWHNGLPLSLHDTLGWNAVQDSETFDETVYRLFIFDHLLQSEDIKLLSLQGIEVQEYVQSQAYLCAVHPTRLRNTSKPENLILSYRISPASKLSTNLLYGNLCRTEVGQALLVIQCMPNRLDDGFTRKLLQQKIQTEKLYGAMGLAYIKANNMQLEWLTKQPEVKFIDCQSEPGQPEDREGRSLHRVNMIGSNRLEGLTFDGSGVKVMVRDDGFVGPHIDFQGRITNDTYNNIGDHGDGVAGILTGAGNLDPLIEGMAPGAELYVINYQPDFLDNTLDYHTQQGVVITNSSYSNGCNVGYTIEAQVVDKQLWENRELLHVFSAGNSNNVDCGYGAGTQWGNVTGGHKIAKNCLTVANLRLDGTLEASSSRGPTKDRRMKPEISARGTNELSTGPDQGTQVFGGTSAAAPGVAGVCALLYQGYKQLNNGKNPESALIKAAIMNTATDIGTPGPDYQFGFGVINAYRAYKLLEQKNYRKDILRHGQQLEIKFTVPSDRQLAKFMIYWPEEQASLMSPKALINDVDMLVKSPTGTIIKPLVLNPSPNPTSLAAGAFPGIDTLNNFEQVSITAPEPGEYTLTITGKFIPSNQVELFTLFEIEEKALRLTYPIGGEQFSITETSQIHFTAYGTDSILISLSTNAGKDWTRLSSKTAGSRLADFFIPNNVSSDSCLIEIQQGTQFARSGFFTITAGVLGFKVSRYCINEMELSWARSSKDSFKIFQLGNKYMDPIAITQDVNITLPNADPRIQKWFSVAGYQGSSLSRRELAIVTPDTLVGCNITNDLGLKVSPNSAPSYYACQETYIQPKFQVINRSSQAMNGFSINLLGDNGQDSETYNQIIEAYDTLEVIFSKGLLLKGGQSRSVKCWLEQVNDQNPFNDTVQLDLNLLELPEAVGTYPVLQEFSQTLPPDNWIISNALDNANWVVVQSTGRTGVSNRCLMLNNPNPVFRNQPIILTSQRADLTQSVQPYLYFDFAHHALSSSQYQDSLRIVVKEICKLGTKESVLFEGRSLQYKTVDSSATANWAPIDTSWYWMAFDLSAFKGSEIIVEFQVLRGHDNRTFLDKFEIREKYPQTGSADLFIEPNPACYSKTVKLTPVHTLQDGKFYLDAGLGASPRLFDGAGPHSTRYVQQGDKSLVLHVKSTMSNDVILIKNLPLANAVSINYTYNITSGRTVQFNNLSTNGSTFLWSFGDGTTSQEFSPVHTYDSAKIYRVKLTVTNPCGTYNRSVEVDLTLTQTGTLNEEESFVLYPNPVKDYFFLELDYDAELVQVFNSYGIQVFELTNVRKGIIKISTKEWSVGQYRVVCLGDRGRIQRALVKVE